MNTVTANLRQKAIVVGLSLDKADPYLLACASALARRLNSPLELVHATQPVFNYMGAGDVVINPYYGYDRVLSDLEENEARQRLEQARQSLPSDLPVGLHVLRDYAAEALMTIATEVNAGLIICGVGKQASNNFLEGLSTAFSLAAHATVPVLILPEGIRPQIMERSRLLIADNLQTEGQRALALAVEWAQELGSTEFCHTHVHKLGLNEVQHLVDKVREAMNLGKIPPNPDFSSKSYIEQIRSRMTDELRSRFQRVDRAAAVAAQYQPLLAFGKPTEELHRLTRERQTQILVFGRHHLFHRQSFALGKIPYDAMMKDDVATLIVPDSIPESTAATAKT